MTTATLSGGMSSSLRTESRSASMNARTPNLSHLENLSGLRPDGILGKARDMRGPRSSVGAPPPSAPSLPLKPEASKRVIWPMPLLDSSRLLQKSSLQKPIEETTPIPVIAGLDILPRDFSLFYF